MRRKAPVSLDCVSALKERRQVVFLKFGFRESVGEWLDAARKAQTESSGLIYIHGFVERVTAAVLR